jgi:hypothetical protein
LEQSSNPYPGEGRVRKKLEFALDQHQKICESVSPFFLHFFLRFFEKVKKVQRKNGEKIVGKWIYLPNLNFSVLLFDLHLPFFPAFFCCKAKKIQKKKMQRRSNVNPFFQQKYILWKNESQIDKRKTQVLRTCFKIKKKIYFLI